MACEELQDVETQAIEAWVKAQVQLEIAEENLHAAEFALAGALVVALGCAVTATTGPGFIACEIAAFLAVASAEEWRESADAILELAEAEEDKAHNPMVQAIDAYCDCLAGVAVVEEIIESIKALIEENEAAAEETESAIADSQSDGEEAEALLEEAEEALEEIEEPEDDAVLISPP